MYEPTLFTNDDEPPVSAEELNKIGAGIEAAHESIDSFGSAVFHDHGEYQPSDADLTAIAALTTTPYGRNLLALADAAAGRAALELGTAATAATGDFDAAGAASTAVTAHSADTTGVHGIADTADLILEGDARLTDARTPTTHAHDDLYFTEAEVTASLAGKADTSHGTHLSDGDKGDITVAGSGTAWTIDNDAVTNAKSANMAESTVKGRAAGAGTGDPTDLTPTQVAALLPTAASSVKGLVIPDGNASNVLKGDGSWGAGGGSSAGVWHTGTALPPSSGLGVDGDWYVVKAGAVFLPGVVYRKAAGAWSIVGYHPGEAALASGMSAGPMTTTTALNTWTASGTATKTANTIAWSGGNTGSVSFVIPATPKPAALHGAWRVDTLPTSGGSGFIEFGCGNYYGVSYPTVKIAANTYGLTVPGAFPTSVATVQAGDYVEIGVGFGFGIIVLIRGSQVIWQAAVTGSVYSAAWAATYGQSWWINGSNLTAGQLTCNQSAQEVAFQ